MTATLCLGVLSPVWASGLQHDLPLAYLEQASPGSGRPLIIFLHGYGSNEQDLFSLREQLPPSYNYLSLRAPLQVEPDAFKWFTRKPGGGDYDGITEELARSQELLGAFIAKALVKYHTSVDRVVLVGFSQGAIMSYEVGLRRPASVRGIAALSGRLLPVLQQELTRGPPLSQLSVFIGHGEDDPQLPVKDATQADQALRRLGLGAQVHLYPGLAHSISDAEVADLRAWLQGILPAVAQ